MIQNNHFYRLLMNSHISNMCQLIETSHIVTKVTVPTWLFPKHPVTLLVSFKDIWALEWLHMSEWECASPLWQL